MSDANPEAPDLLPSEYATDPDMTELLELFVSELPERIDAFLSALQASQPEQLARLAHQLKGAAPGYGYPLIGEVAGKIEQRLKTSEEAGVERVSAEVDELVRLCNAAINAGV